MSESSPPAEATAMATATKPTNMTTDKPPTESKDLDQSATLPSPRDPTAQEFTPGCGLAIFSTNLGMHPKRAVEGQLRPPVIVRSDGVKGVVDAARYWQRKFKVQCLCIFPGQGWTIGDLWDDVDIQLDTPPFCQEMLTFISRETYHVARDFAKDFIRAYPERLSVVGSDMAELHNHNPKDAFAMVDKIYNEGERGAFPRTFLWHVAHMMRAYVLEMSLANTNHDMTLASAPKPALQVMSDNNQASLSQTEEVAASASPSSTPIEPAPAPAKSTSLPAIVSPSKLQREKPRVSSHELQRTGNQQAEPVASLTNSSTSHAVLSPNMPVRGLKLPKGPPRNLGTTTYTQPGPPHNWTENNYRPGSGPYPPRQISGGIPPLTSPQFVASNMAIGQHIIPAGYVASYPHGNHMMAANMAPMPHYNPNLAPPGLMLHPSAMMQNPHMGPVYASQPQAVRGVSMGDMTNNGYYANGMAPNTLNVQATSIRRPSNYNNNGTLFDPYNGANSNFRETVAYNKGKKPHYNDISHYANRPRNISNSGSRLAQAAYKTERAINQPYNVATYNYRPKTRQTSEDDPAITGNRLTGCHEQWIGPENVTVNELFVGDLPMDVSSGEVKKVFEQQMGVVPANVSVRSPKRIEGFTQHERCHAFVALNSTADAKKIMGMPNRSFRLRDDGQSFSVSVPRRFFQLPTDQLRRASSSSESHIVPAQPDDREGHKATHPSARDNDNQREFGPGAYGMKGTYSPQDARSGLRKKSAVKSNADGIAPDESSQVRKPKLRQVSPTKKQQTKREHAAPSITSSKGAEAANTPAEDPATVGTATSNDKSSQDLAQGNKFSTPPVKKDMITIKKPVAIPTSASPMEEPSLSTAGKSPLHSDDREVAPGPSESDPTAHTQLDSAPAISHQSVSTVTTNMVGQPTEPVLTEEEGSNKVPVGSFPQCPEYIVANDEASHNVSSETVLEPQTEPIPTASDGKHAGEVAAPYQEKDFVKHIPEKATSMESTQLTAALEASQTAGSTEKGKAVESCEETPLVVENESIPRSATALTADIPAKPGLQQVSSLHPYAKPNKSQQKKAKDALRKQQKKEQAEKAEKAKAEKAKAEKARAEKNNVSTKAKEAAVQEEIEKSQAPSHIPSMRVETGKGASNNLVTPVFENANLTEVTKGKLVATANGAAVANGDVHEPEHTSNTAETPIPLAERLPASHARPVLNDVEGDKMQINKIAPMASEASVVKPKAKELQDSPVNVPASDTANAASSEPATPTPKKKSKNKRKKKVASVPEENKQGEGIANGKPHSPTRKSNSITSKALTEAVSPIQLDSLSGFGADLATEVRSNSTATLPSSSAPELVHASKDRPILATLQEIIPPSEQLGHSQIVHQQALNPPPYRPSTPDSQEPAIGKQPCKVHVNFALWLTVRDRYPSVPRAARQGPGHHLVAFAIGWH
ncbi:hypothetical protein J1614_004676 [Plenodomus biglobosus]|nr:hypothetical protein J1614_004676 [Plenodomus biglobosus]